MTETLRDLIVRAVEEKGADYVYPDSEKGLVSMYTEPICRYFREDDGAPSCIFGHVLSYLGKSTALEGSNADIALAGCGFTGAERTAANHAQVSQDSGATWGETLSVYDLHYANYAK